MYSMNLFPVNMLFWFLGTKRNELLVTEDKTRDRQICMVGAADCFQCRVLLRTCTFKLKVCTDEVKTAPSVPNESSPGANQQVYFKQQGPLRLSSMTRLQRLKQRVS